MDVFLIIDSAQVLQHLLFEEVNYVGLLEGPEAITSHALGATYCNPKEKKKEYHCTSNHYHYILRIVQYLHILVRERCKRSVGIRHYDQNSHLTGRESEGASLRKLLLACDEVNASPEQQVCIRI